MSFPFDTGTGTPWSSTSGQAGQEELCQLDHSSSTFRISMYSPTCLFQSHFVPHSFCQIHGSKGSAGTEDLFAAGCGFDPGSSSHTPVLAGETRCCTRDLHRVQTVAPLEHTHDIEAVLEVLEGSEEDTATTILAVTILMLVTAVSLFTPSGQTSSICQGYIKLVFINNKYHSKDVAIQTSDCVAATHLTSEILGSLQRDTTRVSCSHCLCNR